MKKIKISEDKSEIVCPFCGELIKTLNYEQHRQSVSGSYNIKNKDWEVFDENGDNAFTLYFCPDCNYQFNEDALKQIL